MTDRGITELAPGKIFFDYGPISMVIAAWQESKPLSPICRQATTVATECLEELGAQLHLTKRPWRICKSTELTPTGQKMWESARLTGADDLTPMAAVAGTIADITADWLESQGATKVFVNNGGDIAVRLAAGETLKAGIVPVLGSSGFSYSVQLNCEDRIGGIATSGLGGRSFTRGIADSVTVLAKSCSIADAFATFLANMSYIEHPEIVQIPAGLLDPNSDIASLLITTKVGALTESDIDKSLNQMKSHAKPAIETGKIRAFAASIQGRKVAMPSAFFE